MSGVPRFDLQWKGHDNATVSMVEGGNFVRYEDYMQRDADALVFESRANRACAELDRVSAELAASREELAALRRDAERYRRLRAGPDLPCVQPCVYRYVVKAGKERLEPVGGCALDDAIDAALQESRDHE